MNPRQTGIGWAGSNADRPYDILKRSIDGRKLHQKPSATADKRGEKRKIHQEEDARKRELAKRSPEVGEAASRGGAGDDDAVTVADGGTAVVARAAGAAMDEDEGQWPKGAKRSSVRRPRSRATSAPARPGPLPLKRNRRRPRRSGMTSSDANSRSRGVPRTPPRLRAGG